MEKRGFQGKLIKKPKNVTIIEGFPGFGLVATIATGFLIEHLKCEKIGSYWFEDAQPMTAIHKNELVDQIGVFYNRKNNVVIINSISNPVGKEWDSAELILDIAKQLQAKQIVSIEGVGGGDSAKGFFYTNKDMSKKKLEKIGIEALGKIIELLDKYLGLDVDYKPLLKQAEEFEEKLKGMLEKQASAKTEQNAKDISYVG